MSAAKTTWPKPPLLKGSAFMRRLARILCQFGIACAAQLPLAASAEANSIARINSQMLMLIQSVSGPNLCISYTYDGNGNVLLKANSAFGPQASWGTSTYGCFAWTAA